MDWLVASSAVHWKVKRREFGRERKFIPSRRSKSRPPSPMRRRRRSPERVPGMRGGTLSFPPSLSRGPRRLARLSPTCRIATRLAKQDGCCWLHSSLTPRPDKTVSRPLPSFATVHVAQLDSLRRRRNCRERGAFWRSLCRSVIAVREESSERKRASLCESGEADGKRNNRYFRADDAPV